MDDVNQKKKMILLGIVLIAILAVVILVVLVVLSAAEAKKTKITLGEVTYKTKVSQIQESSGQVYTQTSVIIQKNKNTKDEKPFMITTPDNVNYYNLKVIAEDFCGYIYNKGVYGGVPDENSDKCHIVAKGEKVSFSSTSNEITKYINNTERYTGELAYKERNKNKEEEDVEIFSLENTPVIKFADGQLYASKEAIEKGLNMVLYQNGVNITVYPLESLITSYSKLLSDSGYKLTANYRNQRALYERLAVCEQNGVYCVAKIMPDNSINKVISAQYESIEYVQSIGNFIVSNKNRQTGELLFGMNSPDEGKVIIEAKYDSLKLLDAKNNLYLTSKDNRYGVIKSENNTSQEIIKTEYQQIGLDSVKEYANQDISNKYILLDYLIVTKKNNTFGLYTKDGYNLLRPSLKQIGCPNPTELLRQQGVNLTASPTIVVPLTDEINALVVQNKNNEKFGLMDVNSGTMLTQSYYTAIYSTMENGKKTYYLHRVMSDGNDQMDTVDSLIRSSKSLRQYIENKGKSNKSLKENSDKQNALMAEENTNEEEQEGEKQETPEQPDEDLPEENYSEEEHNDNEEEIEEEW